jgi:hypothetical protein
MGDVHDLANETDKRLAVHEAICAQRYAEIQKRFDDGSKRMRRIEYLLYLIAGLSLFGAQNLMEILKTIIVR